MAARQNRQRRARAGGSTPGPARVFPLPQALDAKREWTFVENKKGGFVQRGKGVGTMSVPTGTDDRSRQIRIHEMAHVKWTPSIPTGIDDLEFATVNAVEDARITKRLHESGFSDSLLNSVVDDDYSGIRRFLSSDDGTALEAARMWFATWGTGDLPGMVDVLRETGWEFVAPICEGMFDRHLGPRRPAWGRTVELAHELEATFGGPDPITRGSLDPELIRVRGREGVGEWGTMEIQEPPRPLRLPAGMIAPRRRASDMGAVPRNWNRLTTDGRVFTRRRKRPCGGAVLIDQSGSMELSTEDVVAIMARYPGVTIAGYSGRGHSGILRILAKNGMRVEDRDVHTQWGGNIVDGPALAWLADQDGPRVWVCDGIVTGVDDELWTNLSHEAAVFVARHNIERIDDIHGLLADDPTHVRTAPVEPSWDDEEYDEAADYDRDYDEHEGE